MRDLHQSLRLSCLRRDMSEVKRFVEQGADIHEAYGDNGTILHLACWKDIEITRYLLSAGADPNVRKRGSDITPLHMATVYFNTGIIQLLLDAGADIHARDNEGETPLHWASKYGSGEVARKLLQEGADAYTVNHEGWRPVDDDLPLDPDTARLLRRTQFLVILVARADIPTDLIREFTLFI